MGCATSRVAVAPLEQHTPSSNRQPAINSRVVWRNNMGKNRKLAFGSTAEFVDTQAELSRPHGTSVKNTIVLSTASLSGSISSLELRNENKEMWGGCTGDKPSQGSSGYDSGDRSVSQDVRERQASTAGVTSVRSPVERSDVESAEYQVKHWAEPVEFNTQDPLYVRLARLTTALDGHLCGSIIHPERSMSASDSTNFQMVGGDGIDFGRSRSIRSLRSYHGKHSDHETMSQQRSSVTKSVVKALVVRTLSNYGIVDATSLDWKVLTDSVETIGAGNVFGETAEDQVISSGGNTDWQVIVRNSSPVTEGYLEPDVNSELQWTKSDSQQNVLETTSPSLPPQRLGVSRGCSVSVEACIRDELSHDHTTNMQPQCSETLASVHRLSPTMSRKVSSISAVSSIHSRSVTSRNDMEELVEQVSSALIASDQDDRPSAVQMLVLRPAVVAASVTSDTKKCDDPCFDVIRQTELQAAEIDENEDLISVHELYNLLNAGIMAPYIHDPFYLLMLDARSQSEYQQSHVITANWQNSVTKDMRFLIDPVAFLDRYSLIVVYDEKSESVADSRGSGPQLVQRLEKLGIEHVSLVSGGYGAVQESYPFLCNTKTYWSEDDRQQIETFPSAVIPGKLYQGNASHAASVQVFEYLGITHVVNATVEHPNWFEQNAKYLRLPITDERESQIVDMLPEATEFIMSAMFDNGTVLVHCNKGVSRSSTVTISLLMERYNWTLETSFEFLKDRRPGIRPNRGFLEQLSLWEKSLYGKSRTDIDELW